MRGWTYAVTSDPLAPVQEQGERRTGHEGGADEDERRRGERHAAGDSQAAGASAGDARTVLEQDRGEVDEEPPFEHARTEDLAPLPVGQDAPAEVTREDRRDESADDHADGQVDLPADTRRLDVLEVEVVDEARRDRLLDEAGQVLERSRRPEQLVGEADRGDRGEPHQHAADIRRPALAPQVGDDGPHDAPPAALLTACATESDSRRRSSSLRGSRSRSSGSSDPMAAATSAAERLSATRLNT